MKTFSNLRKTCAVVLQNGQILKIDSELKTIMLNPEIFIFETCDKEHLQEKYLYWNNIINYNPEKIKQEEQEFLIRCENVKPRYLRKRK